MQLSPPSTLRPQLWRTAHWLRRIGQLATMRMSRGLHAVPWGRATMIMLVSIWPKRSTTTSSYRVTTCRTTHGGGSQVQTAAPAGLRSGRLRAGSSQCSKPCPCGHGDPRMLLTGSTCSYMDVNLQLPSSSTTTTSSRDATLQGEDGRGGSASVRLRSPQTRSLVGAAAQFLGRIEWSRQRI